MRRLVSQPYMHRSCSDTETDSSNRYSHHMSESVFVYVCVYDIAPDYVLVAALIYVTVCRFASTVVVATASMICIVYASAYVSCPMLVLVVASVFASVHVYVPASDYAHAYVGVCVPVPDFDILAYAIVHVSVPVHVAASAPVSVYAYAHMLASDQVPAYVSVLLMHMILLLCMLTCRTRETPKKCVYTHTYI